MKLLHIIATPREEESRTLRVSKAFLEEFKNKCPELIVEEINLFKEKLPELTIKRVDGKYILLSGKELNGEYKKAWEEIVKYINQFLKADFYLISSPMWNFSIPYILKHYIDIILQPRYLFKYTEIGPIGLVKGKKMLIITSRGGDYSGDSKAFDFQENYLKHIFSFVGIEDIYFIHTQGMDAFGDKTREDKLKEAISTAKSIAQKLS